ncbi:MotA/TolQ/ExbB proton channel family protein [Oricola thermophila]|uniref:MotA/TolQ/ExbB proton channel family protein n=1 Tax=Oricola thermophila TaxID=2742145 RepID=A0A6N1VIN4_9HYPH|nr:MotA/TolQ/ExbB proton channel family protein [Oricola thermophila]QKV20751.1 MotA/TolQ/ExbB proton channel family protein [Oricola thermophila]
MGETEQTSAPVQTHGRFDPYRLSNPQVFLLSMIIFLVIVGFVAAILYRQVSAAFVTNPGLNGLILGVLAVGIVLVFQQVIGLFREVRWVNSFRSGNTVTRRDPVLLAPMRALLSRRQAETLTTMATRSILDSIATRLDESRDTSRYLIGLLVFLGLLGTFWGLLQTIGSIGSTIQSLDPGTGDTNDILDALKAGLSAPLEGMGTAFSSSLFGLSGSLVLGFLDLQAGRAQNRFYTELENWLSSVTDPNSGLEHPAAGGDGGQDMKSVAEALMTMQGTSGGSQRATAAMASLAEGIQGLVRNMRSEQQMMRDWVESQAAEQKEIRETLDRLAAAIEKTEREK